MIRRNTYEPANEVESFIVSLLRDHIHRAFHDVAVWLKMRGNPRVLDVGCGRQPFRERMEAMGLTYVGFDVGQNSENTVQVLGMIDATLPQSLVDGLPFDLLLCTEVLEHVANWPIAFENMAKLLAPGGRLLITCPHFYQLHEEPHDYWRPTPNAIRHFADQSGLRVLSLEAAGNSWDVLGTWLPNSIFVATTKSPLDRALAKVVRSLLRQLFRLLRTGWLQRRLKPLGNLYLSNIAVLEKP